MSKIIFFEQTIFAYLGMSNKIKYLVISMSSIYYYSIIYEPQFDVPFNYMHDMLHNANN